MLNQALVVRNERVENTQISLLKYKFVRSSPKWRIWSFIPFFFVCANRFTDLYKNVNRSVLLV